MASSAMRPVVVVGGGPVGLALGTLLSRAGTKTLVLEKNTKLPDHPQAHFISCRSMEIFKHAFSPSLYKRIQEEVPPLRYWRHFSFCTSVMGMEIGRVDHFSRGDPYASLSPCGVAHLSQKRLMPLLLEQANEAGCEVRLGCEVSSLQEDGEGVHVVTTSTPPDRPGPSTRVLTASHVIGADGAASRVRQLLGVGLAGDTGLQHLMNVHFSSPSLASATQHRPAMLYFVYNKDVVCVLVAHHFESGEFVCQLPYFPPVQTPQDFDEASCRVLLRHALGVELSDVAVHSIRPWTMHCQVAHRYRSEGPAGQGGRVLLAGDAAHRFPPAGGFGMNTGLQDAYNLSWKLAMVTQGHAPDTLLDSYEAERRPAALHSASLSLRNFRRSLRLPLALGLDPQQPKALASASPKATPKALFEAALSLGRRPLASLETPGQAYGQSLLTAARQVLQDGAGLPLLFPTIDLGTIYPPPVGEEGVGVEGGGGRLREIVLGGRMPHLCLRVGEGGTYVSSVDLGSQWAVLVGQGAVPPAVLLVYHNPAVSQSLEASRELAGLRVLVVHLRGADKSESVAVGEGEALPSCVSLADVEGSDREALLAQKGGLELRVTREGARTLEKVLQGPGAVLVRPDGHVCGIFKGSALPSVEELRRRLGLSQ